MRGFIFSFLDFGNGHIIFFSHTQPAILVIIICFSHNNYHNLLLTQSIGGEVFKRH